ncbi:MAG: hypothetical protein ACI4JK_08610 [Oscillospiraceae bacterium]
MDENKQKDVVNEQSVSEGEYNKEPKINYIIYTIISILLFAVLYTGVQFAKHAMFRDYTITVDGGSITSEQSEAIKEYTGFDFGNIEQLILTRENNVFSAEILYNTGEYSSFAEDFENYAEDDSDGENRIAVYPYGNSVPEYVYSRYFVNADAPDMRCYIYEYGGSNYLKLCFDDIPKSIKIIFSEHEKIYRE